MTLTKVILADDHQFLLEGIISVLKDVEEIDIVATVNNGYELLDAVNKHRPQLVVLDLNMPQLDGLQSLKKIKESFPLTKVLVLTNYSHTELQEETKKNLADGYLVKNSSAAELKKAITTVLSGEKYFPAIADTQNENLNSDYFDDFLKKYRLTKREVDIIRLINNEFTSRQIAAKLFLSEFTIATHRRNILRKLDLNNIAGLINFARENQIV